MPVRPTLRCLTDDLGLKIPTIDDLLDEFDHPLLRKANQQFAEPSSSRERISSIDAAVLFKVKAQRWRGAVWIAATGRPWMVAAGWREEGSQDDFYEALGHAARSARARYNAEHTPSLITDTDVTQWLPSDADQDRFAAEGVVRLIRELDTTVRRLIRASLLDGHEHTTQVAKASLGILVRADSDHETYVALRIHGSVPKNMLIVILDLVPGCDRHGWCPELAMPHRALAPGEQLWSNLLSDPRPRWFTRYDSGIQDSW